MNRLTVSVPEAGKMLGLSRSSTYVAVQRGDIPSIRVGGRVLVPLRSLVALVNGEAPAEAEATPETLADPVPIVRSTSHG